jgi:hypothetical protein
MPFAHGDGTLSAHSAEQEIRGVEAQVRWETAACERGVRRYRELLADSTLDQTPPGMSAIRDMMPGAAAAIAAAQEEAQAAIAEGGPGPGSPSGGGSASTSTPTSWRSS